MKGNDTNQHLRTIEPDCATKHITLFMAYKVFITGLTCGLWRSSLSAHLKLRADDGLFFFYAHMFSPAHQVKQIPLVQPGF